MVSFARRQWSHNQVYQAFHPWRKPSYKQTWWRCFLHLNMMPRGLSVKVANKDRHFPLQPSDTKIIFLTTLFTVKLWFWVIKNVSYNFVFKQRGFYEACRGVIHTDFEYSWWIQTKFQRTSPEPKPHALGHYFVVRIKFETTHKKFSYHSSSRYQCYFYCRQIYKIIMHGLTSQALIGRHTPLNDFVHVGHQSRL